MHAVRWFFIAIPFVGLAWVIVKAIIASRGCAHPHQICPITNSRIAIGAPPSY
jgi:hypothetical protein